MGWDQVRRKALTPLLLALLSGRVWCAEGGADGPLPSLQGHRGDEIYSIAFPDEDVIERYLDGFLAGRKDWLQAVLDRSLRYRSVIARGIEERGLPRELMFLPAVESGYQPQATSPRGAEGLWQLMSATASPFGLRMDLWVDERRDFWKATDASLAKLAENFRLFGNWELALAAYNCGTARLTRIIGRNSTRDYWELRRKGVLPRETAAFVPQFIALSRILSYPGRYGLSVDWDESTAWTRIPLAGSVDLRILSRESGVPLEVLARGNAELNFPVTPPRSYGFMLKIPEQFSEAVEKTLREASLPLMEFHVHVVKQGDTLWAMSRSYGVSVELMLEFNPGLAPRALKIGSRILVPAGTPRSAS